MYTYIYICVYDYILINDCSIARRAALSFGMEDVMVESFKDFVIKIGLIERCEGAAVSDDAAIARGVQDWLSSVLKRDFVMHDFPV